MNEPYKLFWEHCMSNMPFRGLKSARKRTAFSMFSGKRDELAKQACCAKRVHQYSLNIRVLRRTR